MDFSKAEIRARIESVLGRQKNLSPRVESVVREKLEQLNWDDFVESVLREYYAAVEASDSDLNSDECNRLLMEAIQKNIDRAFTPAGKK